MALCHKNSESQDRLRELEGISVLLHVLHRETASLVGEGIDDTRVIEPTRGTLCAYVVGCIASVAEGNAQNQDALLSAGALPLVFRTLERCLQCPGVVSNACVAVAHMAHHHVATQRLARSEGCARAILDALAAYRGHGAVQGNVCRAVAELTEKNEANQQAFLAERLPDTGQESDAICLLLEALRAAKGEEDETLATTCCWALSNMTTGNPAALERVRSRRGAEALLETLRRFAQEERCCDYGCRLLADLTSSDSAVARRFRQEFLQLGAPTLLEEITKRHAHSSGFASAQACSALRNLQEQVGFCGRSPVRAGG